MTKTKIYILAFIILIVAIGLIIFYVFKGKNETITQKTGYPISVKNVIINPIEKITNNFVTIEKNDNFLISYGGNLDRGTFFITINSEPVIEVSKQAEQEFLRKLKIDQEYACKLDVILNVPSNLDDNLAEYNFGMSFCPNRPHIQDIQRQKNRVIPYTKKASDFGSYSNS